MKVTLSRVGRSLAPVLSCLPLLAVLAGSALAALAPFALVGGTPKMLTSASLLAAQKSATPGQASADGGTLTFGGKTVRLVAVTGPEDDMLSYRIGGKRNPTLVVLRGAAITVPFVNADDDIPHNLRFGLAPKTYANVMTPYLASSVGTPDLPHKSGTALHGEGLTLRAPAAPGAYAYLCTVRGHAQGGMIGKVVVR